jgi:hypothetical protein
VHLKPSSPVVNLPIKTFIKINNNSRIETWNLSIFKV